LLYSTDAVNEVRLDSYCARVVSYLYLPGFRFEQIYDAVTVPLKIASPVGLILTELITNAIKHAFPGGRSGTISVTLNKTANGVALSVEDDGAGLPEGFDIAACNSLGLTLVRALTNQINGGFCIERAGGTRCVVEFPVNS
jgi:two-component sensor histidine kinase